MIVRELCVALDGSERSLAGLHVAAALAARAGATVTAVLVSGPRVDCAPAISWLDTVADGRGTNSLVVIDDDVAGALLAVAAERPGAVLCLTSHGRTGVVAAALGSVSRQVVRSSPAPVLVVGPRARVPMAFDAVQICVHGSPQRIIGAAATWASSLRAIPWLVAVEAPDEVLTDATPTGAELLAIEGRLRPLGLVPEVRVLHGDAADELVRQARGIEAAVVVASTAARSGVGDLLLGSVTTELVRSATMPVVLAGPSVSD